MTGILIYFYIAAILTMIKIQQLEWYYEKGFPFSKLIIYAVLTFFLWPIELTYNLAYGIYSKVSDAIEYSKPAKHSEVNEDWGRLRKEHANSDEVTKENIRKEFLP